MVEGHNCADCYPHPVNLRSGGYVEPQTMYQRVIVACRTNNDQLYLKLFKVCTLL
jgi:hypothetical protein